MSVYYGSPFVNCIRLDGMTSFSDSRMYDYFDWGNQSPDNDLNRDCVAVIAEDDYEWDNRGKEETYAAFCWIGRCYHQF